MKEKKGNKSEQLLIRLNEVEEKLKKSFEKVRTENESLKNEILSMKNNLRGNRIGRTSKANKTLSELERKFELSLLEIRSRMDEIRKDLSDSNEIFLKDALSTKKQLSKVEKKLKKEKKDDSFKKNLATLNELEELKEDLEKKEKELNKKIEERISEELDKQIEDKLSENLDEKIESSIDSVAKKGEETRKDLSSKIEILKEEKCDRDAANRVISLIREDFLNRFSYLEGEIKKLSERNEKTQPKEEKHKEEPSKNLITEEEVSEEKKHEEKTPSEDKEVKEEKSFFSKVVDSFFD